MKIAIHTVSVRSQPLPKLAVIVCRVDRRILRGALPTLRRKKAHVFRAA